MVANLPNIDNHAWFEGFYWHKIAIPGGVNVKDSASHDNYPLPSAADGSLETSSITWSPFQHAIGQTITFQFMSQCEDLNPAAGQGHGIWSPTTQWFEPFEFGGPITMQIAYEIDCDLPVAPSTEYGYGEGDPNTN